MFTFPRQRRVDTSAAVATPAATATSDARRHRVWLLIALLALLAGILVWQAHRYVPAMVDHFLRQSLQAQGVTLVRQRGSYVGLTGAGLELVEISTRRNGWQIDLTLEQVQANYHWRSLREGRIYSLGVGTIRAHLQQLPSTSPVTAAAMTLDPIAIQQQLQALQLPVGKLNITKARVAVDMGADHYQLQVSGLEVDNAAQQVVGAVALQGSPPWLIPWQTINIALEAGGGPWLPDLRLRAGTSDGLHFSADWHWLPATAEALTADLRLELPSTDIPAAGLRALAAGVSAQIRADRQGLALTLQAASATAHPVDTFWSGLIAGWPWDDSSVLQLSVQANTPLQLDYQNLTLPLAAWAPRLGDLQVQLRDLSGLNNSGLNNSALGDSATNGSGTGIPVQSVVGGAPAAVADAMPTILDLQLHPDPALAAIGVSARVQLPAWVSRTADGVRMGGAVPLIEASGQLQRQQDRWQGSGNLAIAAWNLLGHWGFTHSDKQITADVDLAVGRLPALVQTLLAWHVIKPEQLALVAGELQIKLGFRQSLLTSAVNKPADLRLTLTADKLAGKAMATAFAGARFTADLRHAQQWFSAEPLRLTVAEVSAGVDAEDLAVVLALKPSQSLAAGHWDLQSLRLGLLGGEIRLAAPVSIRLPLAAGGAANRVGVPLQLTIANLQLGQALALYAEQGVSGEGILSGQVPLQLSADGISIANGMLASIAGGVVRYEPGDAGDLLGQGSQQVSMTLQILKDFHFDHLAVTTQFATDGQMQLGVQLQGQNPGVLDGHPVNLNINVEENLYKLLQALQLSDELSRRIENKLSR